MRDERFGRETVAAFEEPLAREILEELQTRHRGIRDFSESAYRG
jgi:hypothetical protein